MIVTIDSVAVLAPSNYGERDLPEGADMPPPATTSEPLAIEDIQIKDVPQYVEDALLGAYNAAAHD